MVHDSLDLHVLAVGNGGRRHVASFVGPSAPALSPNVVSGKGCRESLLVVPRRNSEPVQVLDASIFLGTSEKIRPFRRVREDPKEVSRKRIG